MTETNKAERPFHLTEAKTADIQKDRPKPSSSTIISADRSHNEPPSQTISAIDRSHGAGQSMTLTEAKLDDNQSHGPKPMDPTIR